MGCFWLDERAGFAGRRGSGDGGFLEDCVGMGDKGASVTDGTPGHVRERDERFPRVPIRGRVKWTASGIEDVVSGAEPRPIRRVCVG